MLYFDHETHATGIYTCCDLYAVHQLPEFLERQPECLGFHQLTKNHQ